MLCETVSYLSQPAAWNPTFNSLYMQVLEEVTSSLVIKVLRSAPHSLEEQLPLLPLSLVALAALAHIPSLAAACGPSAPPTATLRSQYACYLVQSHL